MFVNLINCLFIFQSLFELELAGCNEITEAGLWSCLTPRIVSLSLADCINIADEAVGAVAQLLPSLYEFSLQVCSILYFLSSTRCFRYMKMIVARNRIFYSIVWRNKNTKYNFLCMYFNCDVDMK